MPGFRCVSLKDGTQLPLPSSCVLALGTFDGVHLAHRALIARTKRLRDAQFPHALCGVFCFEAPPADTILSECAPLHLCTLEQKLEHFASLGMDMVILADFAEIRALSPVDFVKSVLCGQCGAVAAVCGFNYRFGKNGEGDATLLSSLLPCVEIQEEYKLDGITVSSTRIRSLLSSGETAKAAQLLSYPYTLRAPVIHGKELGRKLGTPTINQAFTDRMLIPAHGVYLTQCLVDQACWYGISNVGIRPTVEDQSVANCETYLLDFSGDLYGKVVDVSFLERIRPEIKFDSKELLIKQIEKDVQVAKELIQAFKK